jgi:LysM repeat protein
MQTQSRARWRTLALTVLVCAGLLLAACTRSANPTTLPPSDTPGGDASATTGPIFGDDSQNATMAAISTEVASQLTQTAVAEGGAGGGGEETVVAPPTETPGPDVVQPTQPPAVETATPIPVGPTTAPQPGTPCPNPYTVKQGDWIYKIARDCGVTAAAIIAANPGINPDALKPGQLLNMPGPGATPVPGGNPPAQACTGTHTVVSGDTLYRLAFNCGLTVEQLAAANNITFPYTIYVGQVLTYP